MSKDISLFSLVLTLLLLLIPLAFNYYLRLNIGRKTVIAASRMFLQLFLIGFFLKYIFELNLVWLNLLWLAVMLVVSTVTVVNSCSLQLKIFGCPVLLSVGFPVILVLFYFNFFSV